MKTTITFQLDVESHTLQNYTDAYVAQLWHIAQANPAPRGAHAAGALAGMLRDEIVRRWLNNAGAELYRHQGHDYAMTVLREHGHWKKLSDADPPHPLDVIYDNGERRRWVPVPAPSFAAVSTDV